MSSFQISSCILLGKILLALSILSFLSPKIVNGQFIVPDFPDDKTRLPRKVPINTDFDHPRLHKFRSILKQLSRRKNHLPLAEQREKVGRNSIASFIHYYKINAAGYYDYTNSRTIPEAANWVSVYSEFKKKRVVGFYIQAISGPMGLSYGEFQTYFNCSDAEVTPNGMYTVPFKYGTKTDITYPHALVWGGDKGPGNKPIDRLRFHFRWTNANCHFVVTLQFLIVLVFNFAKSDYEAFWSQVLFLHQDFEYFHNLATFFPIRHDTITRCTEFRYKDIVYPNNLILPNPHYDKCYLRKLADDNSICPPGPFQCQELTRFPGFLHNKNGIRGIAQLVCPCHPCDGYTTSERYDPFYWDAQRKGLPACYGVWDPKQNEKNRIALQQDRERSLSWQSHGPEERNALQNETSEKFTLTAKSLNKYHGGIMIFAFFVCLMFSIYVGTFFKEQTEKEQHACCGLGTYLGVHISFALLAIIIAWIGIGVVGPTEPLKCERFSKGRQFLQECTHIGSHIMTHKRIGQAIMLGLHLCAITGVIRPKGDHARGTMVFIHNFVGYGIIVLSAFYALSSDVICLDTKATMGLLIALWLVMTISTVVIQVFQKNHFGLKPPQQIWPTIEPVEYSGLIACGQTKKMFLVVYAVLVLIFFAVVVLSFYTILLDEYEAFENEIRPTNRTMALDQLVYKDVEGIIFKCKSNSAKALAFFMSIPEDWDREQPEDDI